MIFNERDRGDSDGAVVFPTVDEDGYRCVGLYGPLTDKKGAEIVFSMFGLRHTGEGIKYNLTDEQEELLKKAQDAGEDSFSFKDGEVDEETVFESFKFIISTPGGILSEMLSIYDVMNDIKKDMEIHTIGLGKVMSAGVPLLAAGTKGKRLIGKNCRVMIHSINGGAFGNMQEFRVESKEMEYMQEQYNKVLLENCDMTEKELKKLLNKGINTYLTAEEAIKYGIADKIF